MVPWSPVRNQPFGVRFAVRLFVVLVALGDVLAADDDLAGFAGAEDFFLQYP